MTAGAHSAKSSHIVTVHREGAWTERGETSASCVHLGTQSAWGEWWRRGAHAQDGPTLRLATTIENV